MANSEAFQSGLELGAGDVNKAKKKSPVSDPAMGGSGVESSAKLTAYHKGGRVKKTGPAVLKKGEEVLTAKQYHKLKAKAKHKAHAHKKHHAAKKAHGKKVSRKK